MKITRITEATASQYDTFVASHADGSFLQARSWGEFQQSLGNAAVRYAITEEGAIVGTAQFLLRTAPKINKQYLYAAYGPLLSSGASPDALLKQVATDFPQAICIRVEPKQQLPIRGTHTMRVQPGKTLITNLEQTEDELLAAMHNKTRYNIRLAAKHGVTVSIVAAGDEQTLKECLHLFKETGHRQGFKDYDSNYYYRLLSFFASDASEVSATLYSARYNGKVLATAIMIDFGNTRTYLFGGSSNEDKQVMAPYALHWQAMRDAKNNGIEHYDWWGLETATGNVSGFAQFKLRFGGETVSYPPAIDIVKRRGWYTLYRILRKLNRLF